MSYSSGTSNLMSELAGWVFVAVLGALAFSYYEDIKVYVVDAAAGPATGRPTIAAAGAEPIQVAKSVGQVEIKAHRNGHFHAEAEVNGRTIEVLVDTGATMVALTYEDAETAGIFLTSADFTHRVNTANGTGKVAPVKIDRLTVGDITVRNVDAAVVERGMMKTTLLGMSFLSRLSRFEMRSGTLVLQE